ncbi:lysyl-trna synthetase [Lasallia pustulata]|uniref:Lysyl-trna synthetase n=1 Tax=Lasallia pustulata TaxID=136370 RepID=A0A1W5D138_9LECA|nr:lysyl-trna synthetase [Lasallia pustulata]
MWAWSSDHQASYLVEDSVASGCSAQGLPYAPTEFSTRQLEEGTTPCLGLCVLGVLIYLPATGQHREASNFLVNQRSSDLIRLRSEIVCYVRRYFLDDCQTEVQTPILAARAGGAIARPFATSATEFPERQLVLRIAPELWLKRMIIGGHDRVFEIGPSFRNEGLDPSHNPEFTTCEFYRAYTNIDELMSITETLFSGLARHTTSLIRETFTSINPPNIDFTPPFRQIEFIPAIEAAIRRELPDLTSATAQADLVKLFHDLAVPLPTSATLPRLLDRLSNLYIEPQCTAPTFVINHPECLSPLSKSFAHSGAHRVSARAELFVNGQELVNMYEEENSPFEQRRKFVEQLNYRDDENTASIDEDYIEALEWGLPPTGGWGCGIDRLCMLLSGTSRIGDVLSFGTLRNVAASTKGS